MNLSEALKKHARENLGVKADATDDQYREAITKALGDGKLTAQKFAELTAAKSEGELKLRGLIQEEVKASMGGLKDMILEAVKGAAPAPIPPPAPAAAPAATLEKSVADAVRATVMSVLDERGVGAALPSPHQLFSRGYEPESQPHIRVRKAYDDYDHGRRNACYSDKCVRKELIGQPATHAGRTLEHASQADKAVIGAFTKFAWCMYTRSADVKMTDHEQDLVNYALHEMPWTGFVGGDGDMHGEEIKGQKLTELNRKALLSDLISGGSFAVPIIYDNEAIVPPILFGEFFPQVDVISLPRGRVVHAFTLARPTFAWGVPEGTPMTPFDTTGLIAGLDTTIYPTTGSVEIGLDFEVDTPANLGQNIIDIYGEQHLRTLDDVISTGNGTTQPLGLTNTTGFVSVSSVNAAAGPNTINDLESLIFGLQKQYRRARGGRLIFAMNDVTYKRFRQIAVASGWNLRLFGENYQSYMMLGYPVKINPNIPNGTALIANMGFYRLYRRQGLQVRVTIEGRDLILRNTRLIVVRSLWGGRIIDGNAVAMCTNLQS